MEGHGLYIQLFIDWYTLDSAIAFTALQKAGLPADGVEKDWFKFLDERVVYPYAIPSSRANAMRSFLSRCFHLEHIHAVKGEQILQDSLFQAVMSDLNDQLDAKDAQLIEKDAEIALERMGRMNAISLGARYAQQLDESEMLRHIKHNQMHALQERCQRLEELVTLQRHEFNTLKRRKVEKK